MTNSLNKKQIHLEEENFDILQLLRQNNQSKDKDGQGHSQNDNKEQQKGLGDSKNRIKDGLGPLLPSLAPGAEKIGGLNNITNLSEIDLSLNKGDNRAKISAQAQKNDDADPSRKQVAPKKSKQDQKKLEREEKLKEKEKERLRKEAVKEEKKRKGTNKLDRKEEDIDKTLEDIERIAHGSRQDQNLGKKRTRDAALNDSPTSPAHQGKLLKVQ